MSEFDPDGLMLLEPADMAAPGGRFSDLLNAVSRSGKVAAAAVARRVLIEHPDIVDALADAMATEVADWLAAGGDGALMDPDEPTRLVARTKDGTRVTLLDGTTGEQDMGGATLVPFKGGWAIRDPATGRISFWAKSDGTCFIAKPRFGEPIGSEVTDATIYFEIGQSPISGRGLPVGGTLDPVHPLIWQFGPASTSLEPATVPLLMHDTPSGLSPATVTAREHAKTLGPTQRLVHVGAAHGDSGAVVATPNGSWDPLYTGPYTNLFTASLAQLDRAMTAVHDTWGVTPQVVVLWGHGESDADGGTGATEAAYTAVLTRIRAAILTHLGVATVPFVVHEMVIEWTDAAPKRAGVRAALLNSPLIGEGVAFARAARDGSNYLDAVHPSRDGTIALGRSAWAAMDRARMPWAGSRPVPPRNLTATRIGGTVTVTFDYPTCAMTGFAVEYSTDAGATWTAAARPVALDYRTTITGITAPAVLVRAATLRTSSFTSAYTAPTPVIGA